MSVTLYVCTTCRADSDSPDGPRAGARLHAALAEAFADEAVTVAPVECLSVCKRPCTVAVASPGRWTYVYGDLDPAGAVAILRDGLSRYAAAPEGIVPWRERPEAFRKGVVARIPPVTA
ncbi:DUF1636 domain-containing protein [Methylobacterium sp. JK268]